MLALLLLLVGGAALASSASSSKGTTLGNGDFAGGGKAKLFGSSPLKRKPRTAAPPTVLKYRIRGPYTVKAGQTVAAIAAQAQVSVGALRAVNPALSGTREPTVGSTVLIPGGVVLTGDVNRNARAL